MPRRKPTPETATMPAPEIAAVVAPRYDAVVPRHTIGGNEAFPGGRAPFFPPGAPMPGNASLLPGESPSDYVADGAGGWRRR